MAKYVNLLVSYPNSEGEPTVEAVSFEAGSHFEFQDIDGGLIASVFVLSIGSNDDKHEQTPESVATANED